MFVQDFTTQDVTTKARVCQPLIPGVPPTPKQAYSIRYHEVNIPLCQVLSGDHNSQGGCTLNKVNENMLQGMQLVCIRHGS